MKVLFIGDIVGRSGRGALAQMLPRIKEQHPWDICIANGENAAGGRGITQPVAEQLLSYGVDILTMGNHTWDNRDIFSFIDTAEYMVRPANYPTQVPGQGFTKVEVKGQSLGIVNLSGQVFMDSLQCPFLTADSILDSLSDCKYIVVDFHAEATAEKVAMGYHLDGKVSAVVGTHTHIQTADERVLPKGTLYITDVGATGAIDSVLGMDVEPVLTRFKTKLPQRFTPASGPAMLCGAVLDLEKGTIYRLAVRQ